MKQIKKTKYYSKTIGKLPKGCKQCVKGEKLVLYITGICPRSCWYCPLSENRKDKDIIFANEHKIKSVKEAIIEAKLSQSKGAGITGGDPLAKLERTIEFIKALKSEFGKKFHIHLYTTFVLLTEDSMKKLYNSGLDEIRFHPDFEKKEDWDRIKFAKKYDWNIGLEIPVNPQYKSEIIEMVDFFENKVSFLNMNEFEISGTNMDEMEEKGFVTKKYESHGVKGSEKFANELLKYCQNKNYSVHYCSSKLKDKVQMQNRFKLRAEMVSTKFDIITDEGMLSRGVIYLKELVPGVDYKKIIKKIDREKFIEKLKKTKLELEKENLELIIDTKKLRLITYPEHIEQFNNELKKLNLVPAFVEEDPTEESFEVEINFL